MLSNIGMKKGLNEQLLAEVRDITVQNSPMSAVRWKWD